jgi:hypothetical protein
VLVAMLVFAVAGVSYLFGRWHMRKSLVRLWGLPLCSGVAALLAHLPGRRSLQMNSMSYEYQGVSALDE